MLDSLYVGMSGLMNFSKGLSNISNNVANMNTPGFKGSQLAFLDLFYRYQFSGSGDHQGAPYAQGSGVRAGASTTKFTPGDYRETGNDLDVAIEGNGFFVLDKDGKKFYTRAGQFVFDEAGFLSTRDDGARVAGLTGGALTDISLIGRRSSPPKATATIKLTNSLSVGSTSFEVPNIVVYDSLGVQHQLTLKFTNDSATAPGQWKFVVLEGTRELHAHEIRYTGGGSPEAGQEKHTFSLAPENGASPSEITLDFSDTNAFSSSESSLRVASQDGYAAGFLSKTAIDAEGNVVLTYSNGQTLKDQRLALASFANPSVLQAQGSNRYAVFGTTDRILGAPGESALGKLRTGGIELSNVELAQEFSELIIVQRGYQASSQVISAANEMIQQVGEIRGRR